MFGQPMTVNDFTGYEIHVGETRACESPVLAEIEREGASGVCSDGATDANNFVWGTYVHGVFDDDRFRHAFLRAARAAFGLEPPRQLAFVTARKEQRLDRLAVHVRRSLDIGQIAQWLGIKVEAPVQDRLWMEER